MKYKLKFEIDYSNMSKDEIRDSKLSEVLNSNKRMMEMEVNPLMTLQQPKDGDVIDLHGDDYKIMSTKFKMDSDCYTIIHLVESVESLNEKKKEESKAQRKIMSQMLASIK